MFKKIKINNFKKQLRKLKNRLIKIKNEESIAYIECINEMLVTKDLDVESFGYEVYSVYAFLYSQNAVTHEEMLTMKIK